MILFDTRDGGDLLPGQDAAGPGEQRLAEIRQGLDLPPLDTVPSDHVAHQRLLPAAGLPRPLGRRPVWVDQAAPGVNDGVSVGHHRRQRLGRRLGRGRQRRPLYPCVPGGEHQREMACRFGVNLVMYALTGNYKTDQVHVPAILERLGQ